VRPPSSSNSSADCDSARGKSEPILVDAPSAAAALSISERAFHSLRKRPDFPKNATVVIGPRCIRFRVETLHAFVLSLVKELKASRCNYAVAANLDLKSGPVPVQQAPARTSKKTDLTPVSQARHCPASEAAPADEIACRSPWLRRHRETAANTLPGEAQSGPQE
jgi:hypothetical protein